MREGKQKEERRRRKTITIPVASSSCNSFIVLPSRLRFICHSNVLGERNSFLSLSLLFLVECESEKKGGNRTIRIKQSD